MASSILGGGESSRLYQHLLKDKEVVAQIGCGTAGRAGPSKFMVVAFVRPGKTPEEVEGLISEEIAKLNSEPVSDKELERARSGIKRGIPPSRESVLNMAFTLADNTALYNDPNRINTESEKRLAVTAADIQKAARTYLRNSNRVVVVSAPAVAPAAAPGMTMPAPKKQN